MKNKPKLVKVNCSFCGNEMECPEDMLEGSEKHMCFECFQNMDDKALSEDMSKVHIDVPMDEISKAIPDVMTVRMVEEIFPQIWEEEKKRFRMLSKKEIAKTMFGEGVFNGVNAFLEMIKRIEEGDLIN